MTSCVPRPCDLLVIRVSRNFKIILGRVPSVRIRAPASGGQGPPHGVLPGLSAPLNSRTVAIAEIPRLARCFCLGHQKAVEYGSGGIAHAWSLLRGDGHGSGAVLFNCGDPLLRDDAVLGFLGKHPEDGRKGMAFPAILLGLCHWSPSPCAHSGVHSGQHWVRRTELPCGSGAGLRD